MFKIQTFSEKTSETSEKRKMYMSCSRFKLFLRRLEDFITESQMFLMGWLLVYRIPDGWISMLLFLVYLLHCGGLFKQVWETWKNSFALALLNIRSLPGQWDALKLLVQELNSGTVKISCLCLQEIWCVPPYEDFALCGYHPIFHLQQDLIGWNMNAGGGVALWCKSELTCTHIPDLSIFEPHVFESVFVKIEVTPRKFLVIGNIYRPYQANISTFKTKNAFYPRKKSHDVYSGAHECTAVYRL